jgi:hypothetical protein
MSKTGFESDLIVLTADKNMQIAVESLLKRPKALGIRPISAMVFPHPNHDPGCFHRSETFLNSFIYQYAHAMVMFDREGCGKEEKTREELENIVTLRLSQSGWEGRASTIVIDPELENWVFSDSPRVQEAMGWKVEHPSLLSWLEGKKYLAEGQIKPSHPKDAMEAALRHMRTPRSSSIYARLAERVSFARCNDPAFLKLKKLLQTWFPVL